MYDQVFMLFNSIKTWWNVTIGHWAMLSDWMGAYIGKIVENCELGSTYIPESLAERKWWHTVLYFNINDPHM